MRARALSFVVAAAVAVASHLFAQGRGAVEGEASVDYWPPFVTLTTTTSATVNWRGGVDGSGSVDLAMASFYERHHRFQSTVSCSTAGTWQHVRLVDLRPGTDYVYLVKPSGKEDAYHVRSFRTMPVKGPFVFVVISDTQEGHSYTEAMRFRYVAEAVARETDALFVLHGGDNAGHDSEGLWLKYFEAADAMLARIAIYPTVGNHEFHRSGGEYPPTAADQYRAAYDLPLHYSFDCAGVRFISLQSPDPAATDSDDPHTSLVMARSQADWLEQQLGGGTLGTFTIHHHPIWDQGSTTLDANLQPWEALYRAHGISANFAGHTHDYQRYAVEGTPYFVVGNAGGRFSDLSAGDQHAPWWVGGETRQLGYLRVTVNPLLNQAVAEEYFVASVEENDSPETPRVFEPPVLHEAVAFPLQAGVTAPRHGPQQPLLHE